MYHHLLVPIDDSILSEATVEQAVNFAKSLGARVTFFHAAANFAASSDGALIEVVNPEAFTQVAMGNARAIIARAEAAALTADVPSSTEVVTSDAPHKAILAAASSLDCDLIFMSSHGRRGLKGIIHGSVTQKLLQETTLPILVSRVESNTRLSAEERAISIIKGEHRCLTSVVKGMQSALQDVEAGKQSPDFSMFMAMLFYIDDYSARLHHPKEDAYLFAALRKRTQDFEAVIDELEKQHLQEKPFLTDLHEKLAQYIEGEAGADQAFKETFDKFANLQWQHMKSEEELIIPGARQYLNQSDWEEIAAAFEENGDPQFDEDTDASFERLFTRLMNQMKRDS